MHTLNLVEPQALTASAPSLTQMISVSPPAATLVTAPPDPDHPPPEVRVERLTIGRAFVDISGERYVGIGGKDGTYYVLRSNTAAAAGELLWSRNVVFGGNSGGFIATTAFDGQRVYGGTGFGDIPGPICDPSNPRDTLIQEPSFHALDLQSGNIDWEKALNYTFAPSTVGNGIVL